MMKWISEHLSLLPQPFGLFAVDVSLHAGLSSADKYDVPQGESSQSDCNWAGQHPKEDDTLVSGGLFYGFRWRWSLIVSLYRVVGVQEQVPAADAAVDAAEGHVQAEWKEVAVVEVAYAIVQPGTVVVHLQHTHVADATVVRSGWFRSDTFLADGHRGNMNFILQ